MIEDSLVFTCNKVSVVFSPITARPETLTLIFDSCRLRAAQRFRTYSEHHAGVGRYWSEQSNARQVYGGYITIRIRATRLSTNWTMAHKHSVHEWRYYVCLLILNTNLVYFKTYYSISLSFFFFTTSRHNVHRGKCNNCMVIYIYLLLIY